MSPSELEVLRRNHWIVPFSFFVDSMTEDWDERNDSIPVCLSESVTRMPQDTIRGGGRWFYLESLEIWICLPFLVIAREWGEARIWWPFGGKRRVQKPLLRSFSGDSWRSTQHHPAKKPCDESGFDNRLMARFKVDKITLSTNRHRIVDFEALNIWDWHMRIF